MNQLQPIQQNGLRVLTTMQLADVYGTDARRISENFTRNENRYRLGKHYFVLEGQDKRNFLDHTQIADSLKNASVIYLWTEKGAWLHAKSLNTDEAWNAYEMLVDDYYRITDVQSMQLPQNYKEALIALVAEVEQREKLEAQNELMKPKADMYDLLLSADNAQTMAEVAKSFSWGRNKMFEYLRNEKILMRNNLPYQRYLDAEYFEVREVTTVRGDNTINVTQTLVTPKGIDYIGKLLKGAFVTS
jgi:phage antirepressor YoqD-like protein